MKKFLTILFIFILSTPCFAKQMTVNQFMSDWNSYILANQGKVNTAGQLLMYHYLFIENYIWPEGWSKHTTADVCNAMTSSSKLIPELTPAQEYAMQPIVRTQLLGIISQAYAKSKEFPEMQKTLSAEQKKQMFAK